MKARIVSALLGLGLLLGIAGTSSATIIYTLDSNNIGAPPPIGTVSLTLLDATHALLTFTSNTGAGYVFVGGNASVAMNVNATSIDTPAVSGNCLSCTYTVLGPGNMDGFGSFNLRIDSGSAGPGDRSSVIQVGLTNTGGTWADEFSVLTDNASGFQVAAHFGICPGGASGDCLNTGFAVNGGPPVLETPEPGVLSLMAVGLLALGFTTRRRQG